MKSASIGLLLLRVAAGSMMFGGHGLRKMLAFGERWGTFADPIGLGTHLSLILAVFAEGICSLAVVIGWRTRLAVLPIAFTMLVAAGVVHLHDPWSKKEVALLYFVPFLVLAFTGPGEYSLDAWLRRRRNAA
jgi:putative oxidoreductase